MRLPLRLLRRRQREGRGAKTRGTNFSSSLLRIRESNRAFTSIQYQCTYQFTIGFSNKVRAMNSFKNYWLVVSLGTWSNAWKIRANEMLVNCQSLGILSFLGGLHAAIVVQLSRRWDDDSIRSKGCWEGGLEATARLFNYQVSRIIMFFLSSDHWVELGERDAQWIKKVPTFSRSHQGVQRDFLGWLSTTVRWCSRPLRGYHY